MFFNSDFVFLDEYVFNGVVIVGCVCIVKFLVFLEGFGFGKYEMENDDEDWGVGVKLEERMLVVGGCIDEGVGEGCGEKVVEGVLFIC